MGAMCITLMQWLSDSKGLKFSKVHDCELEVENYVQRRFVCSFAIWQRGTLLWRTDWQHKRHERGFRLLGYICYESPCQLRLGG